ncbi:MAG: hypothetical protein OEO20_11400 [Gemmatimonadota bacterium]|nr:hypothetical protein [Gemmatimonadota bacterium]MDH3366510.1 hypothetical protein [Gemmatimonadota bacterium]MDH3478899.1 hypothetical protein [Gemmatimonadota bacterium]
MFSLDHWDAEQHQLERDDVNPPVVTGPGFVNRDAERVRRQEARFRAWLGKRRSWHPSEVPNDALPPSNAQRSALEVYDWHTTPPSRYLGYVALPKDHSGPVLFTTWVGDRLGTARLGPRYRCPGFAGSYSERQSITVHGDNGRTYAGTYYVSTGDYARVKELTP